MVSAMRAANRRVDTGRGLAHLIVSVLIGLMTGPLFVGCGGDSEPSGSGGSSQISSGTSFRRVSFASENPAAAHLAELEIGPQLRPGTDPAPWSGTASGGVKSVELNGPDGKAIQATELLGKDGLKYVRGAVPEAARGFNEVTVELAVDAPSSRPGSLAEEARLYLYRDGEKLIGAIATRLERRTGLQLATFRSSLLRGEFPDADEFAVALLGYVERGAVASVTFARRPITAMAPPLSSVAAGGDLPLVRVGSLARRAYGILEGAPSIAEITLADGETFRAALALVPDAARDGESATFTVRAVSGGVENLAREIRVANGDPWAEIELTAAEIGTGPASIEVHLTSSVGDGAAIGALGEPTIRGRADRESPAATVLLLTSDTHRADHLGILGPDAPVSTPHLDALARRGVLFTDCVATTNVTAPSHVALMTGMHVRDTGILTNRDVLSRDAITLAKRFKAAGYETVAATSVFHLSQEKSGVGSGFDRLDAPVAGDRAGAVAVETVASWLDAAGDAPVFAWVHVYDAHTPYSPPAPYDGRYWDGSDPFAGESADLGLEHVPVWIRGLSDVRYPYAQYRAEVDFVDGSLGKLLDAPRVRAGITAFTADHGELFGENGIWWSHSGLYPGIVAVPLILSWPGAPMGERSDVPVRVTDVGRTLLDLSGVPDGELPGRDLRSLLEEAPPPEPRFFLGAHHYVAAIEAEGWFLTLTLVDHQSTSMAHPKVTGEVELFRIAEDRACAHNLVFDELKRATSLRARLIQWLENAPAHRLNGETGASDASADEAMLAALGYGAGVSVEGERYWDPETASADWASSPWRKRFEE